MAIGKKTGGRQKGSLNQNTKHILAICEANGINLFEAMIAEIKRMDDPKDRFDAIEKLTQYVYAKKRPAEDPDDAAENPTITLRVEDYTSK